MDMIVTPATAAAIGKSLLKVVAAEVPRAQRRIRANRERRRSAYLVFQRASFDAMTWAHHILTLEAAIATRAQMIQMRPTLVREIGAARGCTANLLGALAEIRMVGNPKPRKIAEEIAALTGYLYETVPTGRPTTYHRWVLERSSNIPGLADLAVRSAAVRHRLDDLRTAERDWQRKSAEFADCLKALGIAHRDFTLAAQDDLGQGRRWWQRGRIDRKRWFQFWRPAPWPGGWPGPEPQQLVARAKQLDRNPSADGTDQQ